MQNAAPILDESAKQVEPTFEHTFEHNECSEAAPPCRRDLAPVVLAIIADAARNADQYVRSYDAGRGAE